MIILKERINKSSLLNLSLLGEESYFEDIVKCVVDVERGLLAINAELHSDLEEYLLENGSSNKNLYGININEKDINPPSEMGDRAKP